MMTLVAIVESIKMHKLLPNIVYQRHDEVGTWVEKLNLYSVTMYCILFSRLRNYRTETAVKKKSVGN